MGGGAEGEEEDLEEDVDPTEATEFEEAFVDRGGRVGCCCGGWFRS